MGGVVSGLVDTVGDTLSGGADIYKQIQQPIFDNAGLIGTGVGAYLGGPAGARLGGMLGGAVQGGLGGSGSNILGGGSPQAYGNIAQGLLGTAGSMQQNKVSQEAVQAAQRQALAGGQQAANMAAFRPVGTTTTFGTSNFQFDPTTGQLASAGYQLSPQLQAYQNSLMGGGQQSLTDAANLQALGRGYIAQSPEAAAQQYMASQQALLAPSRDMESARLANQLQQTGRTGVSVAQGGALGMANPEQQALANARAIQDLNLAAQAQQQGRAQTQFGQGLLTGAYDPFKAGLSTMGSVEQLGQQPFGLSTALAQQQAQAGGMQGQLYGQGAQRAAGYGILPEMQTSNTANILSGLASPTSQLGSAFGGLFGGMVPSWTTGTDVIPASTFSGYGDLSDLTQYGVF